MGLIELLKSNIALALSEAKSYDLPQVCVDLGLAPGEGSEAFSSKRLYVQRRLQSLDGETAAKLAARVLERYAWYPLQETLDLIAPPSDGSISAITRRNIVDTLNNAGQLAGKISTSEFLNRIFPLSQMPFKGDPRCANLQEGVDLHMLQNDDWSYKDFFDFADVLRLSERRFRSILEIVVHPEVRTGSQQSDLVAVINPHLFRDGFELKAVEQTSGYPVYRVVKSGGVAGHCKNLIFAANGPKPELILADALNNDIQIVKNQEFCLVYDRQIPLEGLRWTELIEWWNSTSPSDDPERNLYRRLSGSLSEVEKRFFRLYFEILRGELNERLPAIIPQVYLHYDPYTLRSTKSGTALARQRMDFLLLLPFQQRVVIEIDGKQHYADGELASPQRYAEMVEEDRNLRLAGYEIYRFGGFELQENRAQATVSEFLNRLLKPTPRTASLIQSSNP